MASRFVLGVDLDGVVGDFYEAIRVVAAEWLGKPLDDLTTEVSYGLAEWGFSQASYPDLHRFAVTQRGLFRDMEPIQGAAAALRRLSERGIYIRVITHRLFIPHFHQEAVEQTVGWLDYWGIPYRDLCLTGDKVAVGADLYVEDAPTNIEALRTTAPTIAFANSTNREVGGLRAESWEEVEAIVHEQHAEWTSNAAGADPKISGR